MAAVATPDVLQQPPRSTRWRRFATKAPSLVGVVALHAAGVAALLQYQPVREALASAAPIMVSLIAPRLEVAPPKPKAEPPPKPRPARPRVEERLVTAPAEVPSPAVAPAPPPPPPPAEPVAAAPTPAPIVAPVPITPPNFLADYLHNPAPIYPPAARRNREQGKVVLRVLVGADGLPGSVELRTSSGSARLDAAALDTVKRWKFVPARQGDRPIAAWVLVPISFVLNG